jgi:hypothetical protein
VGFVIDKVALGQVFLEVPEFFPVSINLPWLTLLMYYLEDKQQAHWWPQLRDIVSPD